MNSVAGTIRPAPRKMSKFRIHWHLNLKTHSPGCWFARTCNSIAPLWHGTWSQDGSPLFSRPPWPPSRHYREHANIARIRSTNECALKPWFIAPLRPASNFFEKCLCPDQITLERFPLSFHFVTTPFRTHAVSGTCCFGMISGSCATLCTFFAFFLVSRKTRQKLILLTWSCLSLPQHKHVIITLHKKIKQMWLCSRICTR